MITTRQLLASVAAATLMVLAVPALPVFAASPITVNKQFETSPLALGATTLVDVTLQNNDPANPAAITAFSDDVSTMGGGGTIDATFTPTTTCGGGAPTISGSTISLTSGTIPFAPSPTVAGSCAIQFRIIASKTGNHANTIFAANVTTSIGSPTGDVTQTLAVQNTNVPVSASGNTVVLTGQHATLTYSVSNPAAGIPLTNAGWGVALNSVAAFTVNSAILSGGCTGTVVTPPTGTGGTVAISGATINAASTCTVTLDVTTAAAPTVTVNGTIAAGSVTDDQAATNTGSASNQAQFIVGYPTLAKSFSPTYILPGGISHATVSIASTVNTPQLTNATLSDALPAGLTIAGTPNATVTNCGAGTLTANAGATSVQLNGATIPVKGTNCVIKFDVTSAVAGGYTNTVHTTDFASTEVPHASNNASATLTVTGGGGGYTISKSVSAPTQFGPNVPFQFTVGIQTQTAGAFHGGTFTDNLPQAPANMVVVNNGTTMVPATTCAGGTITATNGATSVTGSGLSVASGGNCQITFWAKFPNAPPGISQTDQNVVAPANVTLLDATNAVVNPSNQATANVVELPVLTLRNYVASGIQLANQAIPLQAAIDDNGGTTDTNFTATFPLNGSGPSVVLATTPTFDAACPSGGTISGAPGASTFTVTYPSISASCLINFSVIDVANALGANAPANPTYVSQLQGNNAGAPASFTHQNTATFATTNIEINKRFVPNQIQAGTISNAQISLAVDNVSGFAQTQANGVTFSDTLPANVFFAPSLNLGFGPTATSCQQAGQPAPTAVTSGSTITFSNISLLSTNVTQTTCTPSFDVTSNVVGAPLNTIAAGAVHSTSGITNSQQTQASLTVAAGVAVQKSFDSSSGTPTTTLPIGGSDYVRLLLTNSIVSTPLSGGTLTDTLPATLVVSSTTLGPLQATDAGLTLCGGTLSSTLGSGTISLANITIPAAVSVAQPGQCVIYVAVGATPGSTLGTVASNTIPIGGLNIGGHGNTQSTTATTTFSAAPNVTLSKAFSPATINSGDISHLTITVNNTATSSGQLTALTLNDTLPAGIAVAAVPNASTTCAGGSFTPAAGATTVSLTGGGVGINSSCTVTVDVTGATPGIYPNTIPANNVTSAQGASNGSPASATLNIGNISGVTIAKVFAPNQIAVNGTSVVTISVNNTASGSVPLTAMALSDMLPPSVVVAPAPNASTTCTGGTVAATAGTATVALAGGTVAANSSCTITVSVTSGTSGIYLNQIAPGALTDTQAATNAAPANATLNVGNASGVGIAKSFSPIAVAANAPSLLTITINNNGAGPQNLTAVGLTDTLPANVHVAATPNAATTCTGGTITAVAGAGTVTWTGGSVAAMQICTITLNVTSSVAGIYTNTIPANALTDAQLSTNAAPASALLNVGNASGVTLTKAFAPNVIAPGTTSVLTLTLANTQSNAQALTGLTFTDTLPTTPATLVLAANPNASTTCVGGTLSATANANFIALTGTTLAPNATCTVTATVTQTTPGTYSNTVGAGRITTTQGATNATPATADLIIGQPALTVTKTSNPSNTFVSPSEPIVYTIVIKNNGTQAETNAHISDTLTNATLVPGTVTIAGQTVADTVVTGGTPFGTIAVGQTVTIQYSATVNAAATNGATVTNSATIQGNEPCTAGQCTGASPPNTVSPPVLTATKAIDSLTNEPVLAGQTITYSVTVANTGRSPAINAVITDNVPSGITVLPTTYTLNGAPFATPTLSGQLLTIPVPQIDAGKSAIVTFQARVGPTATRASNQVSVSAAGLAQSVESNAAVVTQVPATLSVTKTTPVTTASAGDRVDYQILVAPVGGIGYGATQVVDLLPQGEIYGPGTARVNGKPLEPTIAGDQLIWLIPALGAQATITYSTVVQVGVQQNTKLTNVASASAAAPGGAGLGHGSGSASILITQNTLGSCYPITGRVYIDYKGNGRFEDPNVGLPGVQIFLDSGERVTTDPYGRYDFPCVHPGMHALRLDEHTLPEGAVAYPDRNIDSEKSTRRLVHHIYDTMIIEDINFAVTGKLKDPSIGIPASASAKAGAPPPSSRK